MNKYTIYHNPRCSTSRKALALLEENGIEPKVIEYLKTPPSPKELELLVMKMGCLLYTSDAADERSSVDLGGRRIVKKKKKKNQVCNRL